MFKFLIILLLSFKIYATDDFQDFINKLKIMAQDKGVSEQTIGLLDDTKIVDRVLELDSTQAEFSFNFTNYLNSVLNEQRLIIGAQYFNRHDDLFKKIYDKYGVPKHILIAFWGLESNYSQTTGSFKLLDSLVTLSYDKKRRDFFTKQLIDALILIDKKIITKDVNGSWAGALGGVQFMPSNLLAYGVDADNDGVIDIWHNSTDMFTSAAFFLKNIGWKKGQNWGREIVIPADFDYSLTGLANKKTVIEWKKLGIKKADKTALANSKLQASIIVPMGFYGPKFLVYDNFQAILNWNRSLLYALSVGIMADNFLGTKLQNSLISEHNLTKNDIKFIQQYLNDNGFDSGFVDGILGTKTKNAIRAYQKANNLVADGYAGQDLLKTMQSQKQIKQ